jgi:cysteine protease ATG4
MFSSTPWITYRTGFKEVKNKTGESFVTDAGWGCMIRAGQMYFAQILKKHLKLEEKAELYEIMKLFDDSDEEAMFSIQNIAKLAQA